LRLHGAASILEKSFLLVDHIPKAWISFIRARGSLVPCSWVFEAAVYKPTVQEYSLQGDRDMFQAAIPY
jgi:hypothetical protein